MGSRRQCCPMRSDLWCRWLLAARVCSIQTPLIRCPVQAHQGQTAVRLAGATDHQDWLKWRFCRQTQTHDSCNGDTRLSISVLKVVGSSLPACACFPYALCEQTYHHFTLELSLCTHPIRRPSCDPVVVLALESPEPGVQFGWAVSPGCSAPI
jgi:hypothetical protein